MIAVLSERMRDGEILHYGMVQVDNHRGFPVLKPARCVGGRARQDLDQAIEDARKRAAVAKRIFPHLRAPIALQRSKPPGRTVYSGLVQVGRHGSVSVFERAAGQEFSWPQDPDQAVAEAQKASGEV